MQRAQEFENIT